MNSVQFSRVLAHQMSYMETILGRKAAEYASDNDRLANFKTAADYLGVDSAQACLFFMTKHLVSIRDMVQSDDVYAMESWNEKIGDAINYLVLLKAIIIEEKGLAGDTV